MNFRGLQISAGIYRCVLLGLLAVALTATAQEYTLPVYQLTIAPEDLEALLQNPFTNSRKPAILTTDSMDYPCEVRFRGATARDLPKKSWKVFFEGDGPLGWEETNLNAEYRDKSLMRNALCMDLARALELPAPEFRYISLLVNGEYWGVHHEIESIDEDFFERRGLEMETLFKSVSHACRFAPVLEPERLTEYYEPQCAPQGSIDTLAARFVFFQNADRDSIEEHAEALVDVDNVMRYFATQYAINNQDGFTKNFYLAEDHARLYRLFPWDCDATLGNDWRGDFVFDPFNLDMGLLVVQTLFQRLIAVEDYSDLYYALLDETIAGGFDTLTVRAQQYHDLIQHDVYLDTMKRGTNEEFDSALPDILGYLSGRRDALAEISRVERFDVEDYSRTTDHIDAADDPVFLSARISGDPLFVYSILMQNAEENFWFLLEDDGLHGDSVAGDHIYSRMVTLPDGVPPYYYTFRITPQNRLGVSYWPPAGDFAFWSTPLHVPVIGLSISQPEANSIEIESAVQTSDHETHALVLRNVSDRSIQLGGYVVRLGSSVRMGRIGREAPLRPGQAMIFSNHPEIMRSYNPWDIVAGGFYFPVQPGDTVSLETPSGDRVISRSIEGVFVLEDQVGEVVINEINYHSADNFDPGDWIELHAPGAAVSVFNWILRDDDNLHGYGLPHNAAIPAGGYLIIAENPAGFSVLFPAVGNVYGPLDFGFSGSGDDVRLFNAEGTLVDAVTYDDALPWPQSPDGDGPTLELVSPALDNSDAANWRASAPSAPHGTPGAENSVYTPAEEPELPAVVRDWQIVNVYPNPFNSETRIELLAPRAERTAIMIYDILGRVTQTIPLQTAPGLQSVVWSGNTSEGALAASGIYFIRIGNRETSTLRKVVLLR